MVINNVSTVDCWPTACMSSYVFWPIKTKGVEVLTAVVMKSSIFWDTKPCSPLKVNRRLEGTCRLHLQSGRIRQVRNQPEKLCLPPAFTLVSCLVYSSTLKMEATYSSKTSVDFQRTTRRYIPEDRTLGIETEVSILWHINSNSGERAIRYFFWTCLKKPVSNTKSTIYFILMDE
jgi:hypothetical protein